MKVFRKRKRDNKNSCRRTITAITLAHSGRALDCLHWLTGELGEVGNTRASHTVKSSSRWSGRCGPCPHESMCHCQKGVCSAWQSWAGNPPPSLFSSLLWRGRLVGACVTSQPSRNLVVPLRSLRFSELRIVWARKRANDRVVGKTLILPGPALFPSPFARWQMPPRAGARHGTWPASTRPS